MALQKIVLFIAGRKRSVYRDSGVEKNDRCSEIWVLLCANSFLLRVWNDLDLDFYFGRQYPEARRTGYLQHTDARFFSLSPFDTPVIVKEERSLYLKNLEKNDWCTRSFFDLINQRLRKIMTPKSTEFIYCGRRTIGVPGLLFIVCTRTRYFLSTFRFFFFDLVDLRLRKIMTLNSASGRIAIIAGGERSVYRDSVWIVSRIYFIAGG
jgi:hypothetical protein